uniref:Sugar phosphate transporter domain-containing protein n=1 Tax=Lactuca sativa TaxID=4236 RepID=A0A9R1ULS6_LACSA|nr:hypothetical protein LSAT_V11C800413440 [Lactuca sativa]
MEFKDRKTLPVSKSGNDDDRRNVSPPMTRTGVYAAVSYMACAVLLIMFNKAALSSYKFPCANVITLFQMICSSILLYALRCRKIISFRSDSEISSTKNIPGIFIPSNTLIRTLPLAISYLLYMVYYNTLTCSTFYHIFYFLHCLICFLLSMKVGFNGICSWRKCAHVHNT